jgi:MFS family permease
MSATLHDPPDRTGPATLGPAGEIRRGWRALTAATVGIGTGVAVLPFYTNGLFIPELEAEFGWSRSQLSSLQLVGSTIIVLTAPLVGAVIDRYGVRIPSTLSLLALGAAYFLLAAGGASFAGYLLVFALMFLLAAASTPVSFTRAVNERFDRARGLALGVALGGAGLVAFLVPQLLGARIAEDWRSGYQILGTAVLTGAVLVLVLMPRTAPTRSTERTRTAVPGIAPVLRTALFARLAAAFLTLALAVGGLTLHLVPMLRDAGVAPASAAGTAGLVGIAVIVGRVSVGLLVDRFFAPRVAAAVLTVAAAGYLALLLGGPGLAAAAALGVGLALGAEVDLIGYLTARYYGMARYGRLFGVFYAVFTLGVGASPLLMAWLRSATGGYGSALLIAVGLLAVAGALLATAPRFPAPAREELP